MKKTVAIVGLGLMGGALGQALRRTRRYRVIGLARKARTLRDAKRLGAIDLGSTDESAVSSADIVVLCSPVDTLVPLFKKLLPHLKPDAIVTDVGSVKQPLMAAIARIPRPRSIAFVGGHPLAGSHKTGVKASHPRLFERSTVVLVPGSKSALAPLKSLWSAVGARVLVLSAEQHDRAVALISHLPHVLAHALVHFVAGDRDRAILKQLFAGSFRDATRVASADPDQWAQILHANAQPVRLALQAFIKELQRTGLLLNRPHLKSHLQKSHRFRRPLFHGL